MMMEAPMLYFAYGSNLDTAQMRARCPRATPGPRATLANHELLFAGWSERWGGSVASVQRKAGAGVPGLLYEIDMLDLVTLDRIEGTPWVYERVQRMVVDEAGQRRRACTYQLRDSDPGAPSADYLGVIQRAYQRLGFEDAELLRVALPGPAKRRVFVYGSLLAGLGNHRVLRGAPLLGPARTPPEFAMFSLGGFPGVVRGGETAIEGEVYEVDAATLAGLDQLEGHPRFYRREPLRLPGFGEVETYLLTPEQVEGCPPVPSGCWRTHRRKEKPR
jgi:gamma-glutamylcyclotransferase (GGCT)/AIG2-like uncharacterized protein YtfP